MKSKFDISAGEEVGETRNVLKADVLRESRVLKIDRILVPVDFSDCSERALCYALAVAEKFSSTVILLHVVEPSRGGAHLASRFGQVNQQVLESARDRVSDLCRKRMTPGTSSEILVRMGLAHSEISDTAKALACDLIIMGTRGRTAPRSTLGSTADWVVHNASCPVLTLRPC